MRFLRNLPAALAQPAGERLRQGFPLSASGNSEILLELLLKSIQHDYQPAFDALEKFLLSQGRRKFLKPLYEKLAETESGRTRARTIYDKARPTYHAVSRGTIDGILKWRQADSRHRASGPKQPPSL